MRTKLLVSLLLAAASSSVFAMPSEPVKHSGILEIALTGGGFVVGTENTVYGMQNAVAGSPFGDLLANDSEYKFGGSVLFGYYFPCSSINVDASYFGTRNRTTDDDTGIIAIELSSPAQRPNTNSAAAASSSYHYDYDFANIEVGSLTRVNNNGLIINPKLGLSYARLKGDQNVGYTGLDVGVNAGYDARIRTKFDGFGPSIGFDLNYIVCSPINLTGSFRYNALVGDIDANYATATTANSSADIALKSDHSLVSLVQSELALGYDFDWIDAFCGNIAIGYQLTKAIGSGQKLVQTDDVQTTFITNSVTDTNIHGWFLRLTMDFPV